MSKPNLVNAWESEEYSNTVTALLECAQQDADTVTVFPAGEYLDGKTDVAVVVIKGDDAATAFETWARVRGYLSVGKRQP